MTDDRWRDSYDEWKLQSPYDDRDDEPENDCDHSEYDVDWEGRATCDYCGESWPLTGNELRAHDEARARWMAAYDRMQWREQSRLWRAVGWLRSAVGRLRIHPRRATPITDDDIPF